MWNDIHIAFLGDGRVQWPTVCHRIFKTSPAPNDPQWKGIRLEDVMTNLAYYYNHDPAAQCYLVYKGANINTGRSNTVLDRFTKALRYPESTQNIVNTTPEDIVLDTKIRTLVFAANLGLDPDAFYIYASNVFNVRGPVMEPSLELPPSLDAS